MNLNQIKSAIASGKTVCWKSPIYLVMQDSVGKYLVVCTQNMSAIGLTWLDGVTLNGNESDFYIHQEAQA